MLVIIKYNQKIKIEIKILLSKKKKSFLLENKKNKKNRGIIAKDTFNAPTLKI
jgi:hypothetical protein